MSKLRANEDRLVKIAVQGKVANACRLPFTQSLTTIFHLI